MNDLTKQEAKEAMLSGKKLTHKNFLEGETVMSMGNLMLFEEFKTQDKDEFWWMRMDESWNTGWSIVDERRYKSLDDMESRIQILDRCAKKFGKSIDGFEEFCNSFNSEAIIMLVYHSMNEYSSQERARSRFKLEEEYTDQKIEEMMIETMKNSWSHCFIDGKLCQRPKNFEDELQHKITGAKLLFNKII